MDLSHNPGQARFLLKTIFSLHTLIPNQGTMRILGGILSTKIFLGTATTSDAPGKR